jgi:hypothetical protein
MVLLNSSVAPGHARRLLSLHADKQYAQHPDPQHRQLLHYLSPQRTHQYDTTYTTGATAAPLADTQANLVLKPQRCAVTSFEDTACSSPGKAASC